MCLATQEINAVFDELLLENEREHWRRHSHARRAEVNANADVKLDKSLDPVQVPGMHVDVVDRGRKDDDAIELSDTVGRKVDSDAVQESVLETAEGRVDSHMEDIA